MTLNKLRKLGVVTMAAVLCATFACSRRSPAPLAVSFLCSFDGHDRPLRVGINLATGHGIFAVSDDAFVDVLPVAKENHLALLPGGQEHETPQVRISLDGTAILRAKIYPAVTASEYTGRCERS
jgi:hypothetical protein